MRSLATPGWGPPAVVVRGCLPLLGVVLVAVPCHSSLGSAGRGGGRLRGVGWGFLVVCVFVAVVWVWVCLPCVLARVWRRVAVCFPGWGLLLV